MEGRPSGPITFNVTPGVIVTTTPVSMDPAGEAYARVCRVWARHYTQAQREKKAAHATDVGGLQEGGKLDNI
jgi:hypothetical protein